MEDIVGDYARYYDVGKEKAREIVTEHAPSLARSGLGPVKVRLVAEAFRPSVTSMVLWLQEYELDIGCIQVSARRLGDGNAVITSRQLLPLPVADDYLVRRRRREREEEVREASGRRQNVVAQLIGAGAIEPGTELHLNLDAFTQAERKVVEPEVQNNSNLGVAEWVGLSLNKALRWREDGSMYSATGLVLRILESHGYKTRSAPGPMYWRLPDGRTLVDVADALLENGDGV